MDWSRLAQGNEGGSLQPSDDASGESPTAPPSCSCYDTMGLHDGGFSLHSGNVFCPLALVADVSLSFVSAQNMFVQAACVIL